MLQPVYDVITQNKMCHVQIDNQTFEVPRYRLEATSTGSSTKVIIYDSWLGIGFQSYVSNHITSECK